MEDQRACSKVDGPEAFPLLLHSDKRLDEGGCLGLALCQEGPANLEHPPCGLDCDHSFVLAGL